MRDAVLRKDWWYTANTRLISLLKFDRRTAGLARVCNIVTKRTNNLRKNQNVVYYFIQWSDLSFASVQTKVESFAGDQEQTDVDDKATSVIDHCLSTSANDVKVYDQALASTTCKNCTNAIPDINSKESLTTEVKKEIQLFFLFSESRLYVARQIWGTVSWVQRSLVLKWNHFIREVLGRVETNLVKKPTDDLQSKSLSRSFDCQLSFSGLTSWLEFSSIASLLICTTGPQPACYCEGRNFRRRKISYFSIQNLSYGIIKLTKKGKTRSGDRKACKPGGRKFGMEINFVHLKFFQLYESYEIKFHTKISSFTVHAWLIYATVQSPVLEGVALSWAYFKQEQPAQAAVWSVHDRCGTCQTYDAYAVLAKAQKLVFAGVAISRGRSNQTKTSLNCIEAVPPFKRATAEERGYFKCDLAWVEPSRRQRAVLQV